MREKTIIKIDNSTVQFLRKDVLFHSKLSAVYFCSHIFRKKMTKFVESELYMHASRPKRVQLQSD